MKVYDSLAKRDMEDLLAEARESEGKKPSYLEVVSQESVNSATELIVREEKEPLMPSTIEISKGVAKNIGSDVGNFFSVAARKTFNFVKFIYATPSCYRDRSVGWEDVYFTHLSYTMVDMFLGIPMVFLNDKSVEYLFLPLAIRASTNALSGTYEYLRHKKKEVVSEYESKLIEKR